jgi:hypothetical protein
MNCEVSANDFVIPAKAGIQGFKNSVVALDPRLRGGDGIRGFETYPKELQ